MGQTLSEPVVEKHPQDDGDARYLWGLSHMQGWRISMEDAHAAILRLKTEEEEASGAQTETAFFGVYDGHGGHRVAEYTGNNLHKIVAAQEGFKKGDFEKALKDGFLATDRAILNDKSYEDEVSGCTATTAIIANGQIFCGNAGDSRTVLGIKGRAKPLSQDHKPQNEAEKARITAAGGFVDFGRVNGNLALSRAIGDFEFKKSADLPPEQQIVTAFPDVSVHTLTEDDEFLIVACDGIWDVQSSQAAVEFVRRGIVAKQKLSAICDNMMDQCVAATSDSGGVGCDNMTVIIVALLQGKTKEEWYDMVGKRVAAGEGQCAPPEYAEFHGPGVQPPFDGKPKGMRSQDISSEDEEDEENGLRRARGGIIYLGDGSEILTDSHDGGIEDRDEEEDLQSQVQLRGGPPTKADENSKLQGSQGSSKHSDADDFSDNSSTEGTVLTPQSSNDGFDLTKVTTPTKEQAAANVSEAQTALNSGTTAPPTTGQKRGAPSPPISPQSKSTLKDSEASTKEA